jgi:hypothetical protein
MLSRISAYVRRHHVALLALFFALGGTALAAGNNLLPRNSVGTAQVVNGSLQKVDLSRKAITALKGNRGAQGLAGAVGAKGPTGAQGPKGEKGDAGTGGSGVAFNRTEDFGLDDLPAGSYQIIGKVGSTGGTGTVVLACNLLATPSGGGSPTTLDHADTRGNTDAGITKVVVPVQALVTFSVTQDLFMQCTTTGDGTPILTDPQLSAIAVGAIHSP